MKQLHLGPRVVAAALTCALAACGGGGGGGNNSPTVTVTGDSFRLVGVVPSASVSNALEFTISGGSGSYYAEAISQMSGVTARLFTNGNGAASVTLSDQTSTTTTGVRNGVVTVKVCSDAACSLVVWSHDYPVESGRFQISSSPISLAGKEGGLATATLAVSPPDTGHLIVASGLSTDGQATDWLTASEDAAGNLVVSGSGVGLRSGSHPAALGIGASASSVGVRIPVVFNVGLDMSVSALPDVTERVDASAATLTGAGSVAFAGVAGPWTATSDKPWLVVDTPSGTGAGALRYHVDQAAADALVGNWDALTTFIRVQASGLSDVNANVTYRRQLPEVAIVTPSQVLPGQAATVRVSGHGLSQLPGVGAILVGDRGADGGTIDSDTQATLHLAARAAGSVQVGIANSLGIATAQANLAVAARLPAALVASADDKTAILYDPSRQAVFSPSYTGQTLQRWKFDGSAWSSTTLPWGGILRVGMAPDRRTLFVVDKTTLSELDPDTLAVRTTHAGLTWQSTGPETPLSITADLRLWLPDTSSHYFDLRSRTIVATPAATFANLGADTLQATPDGMHLYGTEGYYTPAPSNAWYSSDTQASTPLPGALLNANYSPSFDLAGDLGAFNWGAVYHTGSWTLAGTATAPAADSNVFGGVMSPDGTRLYVLAAPKSNGSKPDHVTVFDMTRLQPGTSNFVVVGSIPVATPAVVCAASDSSCDIFGRLQIDDLGATLFWAGNTRLVVVPIPAAMSGVAAARARAQGPAVAVRVTAPRD